MTNQKRIDFEKDLKLKLRELTSIYYKLSISKNKIHLKSLDDIIISDINIIYSNNGLGYYTLWTINNNNLSDFINSINPPYKSNLLTNDIFSSLSTNNKDKLFGETNNGIIPFPNYKSNDELVDEIILKIKNHYINQLENWFDSPIKVIKNIMTTPDDYAYPLLTCLFIIQKHDLSKNTEIINQIKMSKSIFKNKKYETDLIEKIL